MQALVFINRAARLTHPVGDALEEALSISEALRGQADALARSSAREADHVFL